METRKTLSEIELEVALKSTLRASLRRRAAAEILFLTRPARRLSRRDVMAKTLGLRDRFNAKTLDRALKDLANAGFLTPMKSLAKGEPACFEVIYEA